MNYDGWVQRAGQFVERFERNFPNMAVRAEIGPPASLDRVGELQQAVGRSLPEQLRDFLLTGSGECEFGYWWEAETEAQVASALATFGTKDISGGLENFCDLRYMARDYHGGCAAVLERVSARRGEAPCKDPLPIGTVGNGDYLILDLAIDGPDSPVIYLAHDAESYRLAPSFDQFLESWETIAYLDPALDRPFRQFVAQAGGGIVTADTPELRQLNALLSPRI